MSVMNAREYGAASELDPASLIWEDERHYRVHTRAYTDQAVFDAEMERIFARVWVFVGHDSEIPNPGDYKTAYIGTQPVIVTRADDGAVHVLVNRCVHRGAVIAREARGTVRDFTCPYHGWVFALDGKLLAVSERNDSGGYAPDFDVPEGLHRVPRVDSYRGLIFACLDPDAVDLDTYLGRAKKTIDRKFGRSPVGRIAVRGKPFVMRYQGNWKFQVENIVDAYHFLHTHKGFVALQAKYGETTGDYGAHKGGSAKAMRQVRFKGSSWALRHGHAQLENSGTANPDELLSGPHREYYEALRDIHGPDEFPFVVGRMSGTIFPNLGLIHQQIRTWRPIAPDVTEVTIYLYDLVDAPKEFNDGWMRSQERFYGPAGHGMADDVDIFARNQQGLAGSAVEWLLLERGLQTDEKLANGDTKGLPASEAPQRALWQAWKQLMAQR
ncbi:2-halobenzoate 1,2-dioxygenase large subunit [Pigmentiphaga humi]|uniref:2-halobenzoate 1,2-dioxygenase large subunit n=1 Tax=Pigmentiphaga humi TaxID=2478468 RepID=A0A3P4AZD3_9BURK|nr:Rieske 2Fe-2S domain-containing protein [Pigmentiphaga humi]VCU69429.1 2-halobenzoate 1,2-dioxygenase large subunit [Pigmentiphaga humi]